MPSLSLDLSLLTLQQQVCGLLLSPRPLLALKAVQVCVKAHPVQGRTLMACLSLQELHQKRAQKALDAKRLAEEEIALVKESRRVAKKKPAKPASARNISPASSVTKANNAGESLLQVPDAFGAVCDMRGKEEDGGAVLTWELLRRGWWLQVSENSLVPAEANFHSVAAEPEESGLADLGSMPSQDPGVEDKLQVSLALPRGAPGRGGFGAFVDFWGDVANSFTARCVVFSSRM